MFRFLHKAGTFLLSLFRHKTIGVRALIIKNNNVLLIRHTYLDGWYTVGGIIDAGESPIKAICREMKEEVGIHTATPPILFGIYHNQIQKIDDYVAFYIVTEFIEDSSIDSIEIAEKKWFSLNNLPKDISISTKNRINEYLGELKISDKW